MRALDRFPAHHAELPGGLRLVTIPLPHLSAGYAAVACRTGPRHESPATHGLSHFCEHMLFRGAGPYRDSRALNAAAEAFMGSLEAHTSRDMAVYGTTFEPDGMGGALDLLGHMMSSPRLQHLRVEKQVILNEIQECFDEDGREIEVDNVSRRAMYGEHPAGLSIDGTMESVRRFGTRHLRQHIAWHYVTGNLVVVVAGPVNPRAVERAARRAFRAVPVGPRRALPGGTPAPRPGPRVVTVHNPGAQSALRLSFPAYAAAHPAAQALSLMRRVLDDGFTSRFQRELVDRRGLAYEMWADVDALEDHGVLELGAQVSLGREPVTAAAMLGETAALARTAPRKAELDRARERLHWALVQMGDHAAGAAEWHARSVLMGLEGRPERVMAAAHAVTPAEVRRAAQDVVRPDHLWITAVGPLGRAATARLRASVLRALRWRRIS